MRLASTTSNPMPSLSAKEVCAASDDGSKMSTEEFRASLAASPSISFLTIRDAREFEAKTITQLAIYMCVSRNSRRELTFSTYAVN